MMLLPQMRARMWTLPYFNHGSQHRSERPQPELQTSLRRSCGHQETTVQAIKIQIWILHHGCNMSRCSWSCTHTALRQLPLLRRKDGLRCHIGFRLHGIEATHMHCVFANGVVLTCWLTKLFHTLS